MRATDSGGPGSRGQGDRGGQLYRFAVEKRFRRHRKAYSLGIAEIDAESRVRFGKGFTGLTGEQQVTVLKAAEEKDRTFFDLILNHTRQGFYGDPRHGGNKGMASWKMLGLRPPGTRPSTVRHRGGAIMALKRVNAVIVGAGAGGGVVAKELATAGLSVVLLERGKWYTAADCRKDDLLNQRTSVLARSSARTTNAIRACSWTIAGEKRSSTRATAATATTPRASAAARSATARMAWRFIEKDFRMRSTYGAVEGSTLEDWPISYRGSGAVLREGGVGDGRLGRRSSQPLQGAAPQTAADAAASAEPRAPDPAAGGEAARAASVRHPDAAQQRAVQRPRRLHALPLVRGFRLRSERATGTHNTVIPTALATGNCELRTECMDEGDPDRRPRAGHGRGVLRCERRAARSSRGPRDRLRRRHRIGAPAAQHAAPLFPNGLGNRYDWVGRNLQWHTYTGAIGAVRGRPTTTSAPARRSPSAITTTATPGSPAARMLANEFIRLPYQFIGAGAAVGARDGGRSTRIACASAYRRTITVMGPVQEMPLFDSRVQVDPKVRDHWGIPVARLSGQKTSAHHRDRALHRRQGRGVAEGGGRGADLEAESRARHSAAASTRPARAAWATIRRRPSSIATARSRRGQRLRDRRQRACHQRRIQSGADDHGERVQVFEKLVKAWKGSGATREEGNLSLRSRGRRHPARRARSEPLLRVRRRKALHVVPRDAGQFTTAGTAPAIAASAARNATAAR